MPIKEKDTLVLKKEISEESEKSKHIRISPELYKQVCKLADDANISIYKAVRLLLEFAIERAVVEK